MEIIKPKKIVSGDTVGIVSPSAYIDGSFMDQFQKGVDFLEDLGLKVKIGKNVFQRHYYSAGTVSERVADIHEMFADPEVKLILQSQGGETANELLDRLDWELIKCNPKIFAGMSDGTTLLLSIFAKTGMVSLHGPDLLWGYGRGVSGYEAKNLEQVIFSGKAFVVAPDPGHLVPPESLNSSKSWKCWRPGIGQGRLLGGNIGVVQGLLGTEFSPSYRGVVLFLEGYCNCIEELAWRFANLRHEGIFKEVNGVVLGYFYGNQSQNAAKSAGNNRPIGEVLLEASAGYDFPILEIGEIGHNTPNCNLPVGAMARLDAGMLELSVSEDYLL